jgi:hypothetical protein
MNCKDVEPLLYLVREGELSREEENRLAAHLATCEKCRKLRESVTGMTRMMRQADYVQRSVDHKSEGLPILKPSRFLFVKGMAATLLVLIGFSFYKEETVFYRNRFALESRFKSAESIQKENRDAKNCLLELKRKYRVKNLVSETKNQNLINEQELEAYIEQACASDGSDMSKVEDLLMQAGLIKNKNENLK